MHPQEIAREVPSFQERAERLKRGAYMEKNPSGVPPGRSPRGRVTSAAGRGARPGVTCVGVPAANLAAWREAFRAAGQDALHTAPR